MSPIVVVLSSFLFGSQGWAQDAPDGGIPGSLRAESSWAQTGPTRAGALVDVAINPSDPDIWVAAGADGSVWLTVTDGKTWIPILNRLATYLGDASNDEDVMRDVEAFVTDLLEDQDLPENDFDADDDEAEQFEFDESAIQAAADDARATVTNNTGSVSGGRLAQRRSRVWFTPDGWLLVGRNDGLWLSTNLGGAWERVMDEPTRALEYLPERRIWVAGTDDGMRFAVNVRAWIDAEDGTEGLVVYDIASAEEGWYAATGDGLWFADDAQTWLRVGNLREPVYTVLADPNWERGLWVATDAAVLRSDDGGNTILAEFGSPVPKVSELVLLGRGHLLAVGSEGPWESIDGGTTWFSFAAGLSKPSTLGADFIDGRLLLASQEGIFTLGDVPDLPPPDMSLEVGSWMPVGDLITAGVMRPEFVQLPQAGGFAARRLLVRTLPQIQIAYDWRRGYPHLGDPNSLGWERNVTWRETSFTEKTGDIDWAITLRAIWVAPGSQAVDRGDVADAQPPAPYVLDGVVVMGDNAAALLSNRVGRKAVKYRSVVVEHISELYFARLDIVRQRESLASSSLAARVDNELKIEELEARLDLLTGGAVSRWSASALP